MKRMMAGLLLLAGTAGAGESDLGTRLSASARGDSPALRKTSALTATSYTSTYFNVKFTCPSGWTIANFDSTTSRVTFNVVKSGRNNVVVYVTRNATATEATLRDSWSLNSAIGAVWKVSYETPAIAFYLDTTLSDLHVTYAQLEYSLNGTTKRIYDVSSASTGTGALMSFYATTLSDYNANGADYDAVGAGLDFNTYTPVQPLLAKGASGVTIRGNTVLNPGELKIEFLDAIGRKRLVTSEKRIQMDPAEKLFLKVRAR
jgi:hypothetical protein